ncbi:polysaccharide deacetylase family protein [Glacieibacterium megasporae]|uniref:polysaccharide deacetylase family protein n=1 Tax=Glacieibacterium megasporae TaxID=2835787 RepID=UPI001C1E2D74|nr:polysaccharide deacetylase family protein [Polymorphobacter megasporae]UAJ10571.1 polysaccharide deacetylase family protein [Polymorphobacter megasporae]
MPNSHIEDNSALTRREFAGASLTTIAAAAIVAPTDAAVIAAPTDVAAAQTTTRSKAGGGGFWPNDARLAVSISLMFEGGGQPISGAGGPITEPIKPGFPDHPTNAFFAYGPNEGIPRALNLFDKHGIKVTAFMISKAIEKHPELAREIVNRGHEAAAHGRTWSASYDLPREEEKAFIQDSVEAIQRITGQRAVGWNAYWLRNSIHISETLQDLGFLYSIDEPDRDEPFILRVRGRDFVMLPYTIHMNDMLFPFQSYDPAAHEQALRDEFDQLYEEGSGRRRMMVLSMHDRLSGHANRIRVLDRFLTYAKSREGVWFARKDEIAQWALKQRDKTPVVTRGTPAETGLP